MSYILILRLFVLGLDIHQVDLVINYGVPFPTDYIHRVGRAGRSYKKGIAISLIVPRDIRFLKAVEIYIGYNLKEMEISGKLELDVQPKNEIMVKYLTVILICS